ncbi:MAG: hypothetical protein HFE64_06310 [Lachnospiraceae bacterium]|jgi:hypothetical protein|nr:hypothetical protein [Lachnospiraceae bacterium]
MINKEKIQLMTQAASYETSSFQKDAFAKRYYKKDYIGLEKLKSKIWLTVFYIVYLMYTAIDEFYVKGADLLHYDYTGFVIHALVWYAILLLVISGITAVVYGARYDKAKKRIDHYYDLLDQINNID